MPGGRSGGMVGSIVITGRDVSGSRIAGKVLAFRSWSLCCRIDSDRDGPEPARVPEVIQGADREIGFS